MPFAAAAFAAASSFLLNNSAINGVRITSLALEAARRDAASALALEAARRDAASATVIEAAEEEEEEEEEEEKEEGGMERGLAGILAIPFA